MKAALIGAGQIARQHLACIKSLPGVELAAVCDLSAATAEAVAERSGASRWFTDHKAMLETVRPDVVHITTPPQGHFPLAKQCLEAGCHVYLEKPFTVTADETEELVQLATRADLKLTAGHNLQFTLEMLEMRTLVAAGFLGGAPVHLESHFPYGLDDTTYVGPVLGSRNSSTRLSPCAASGSPR